MKANEKKSNNNLLKNIILVLVLLAIVGLIVSATLEAIKDNQEMFGDRINNISDSFCELINNVSFSVINCNTSNETTGPIASNSVK